MTNISSPIHLPLDDHFKGFCFSLHTAPAFGTCELIALHTSKEDGKERAILHSPSHNVYITTEPKNLSMVIKGDEEHRIETISKIYLDTFIKSLTKLRLFISGGVLDPSHVIDNHVRELYHEYGRDNIHLARSVLSLIENTIHTNDALPSAPELKVEQPREIIERMQNEIAEARADRFFDEIMSALMHAHFPDHADERKAAAAERAAQMQKAQEANSSPDGIAMYVVDETGIHPAGLAQSGGSLKDLLDKFIK